MDASKPEPTSVEEILARKPQLLAQQGSPPPVPLVDDPDMAASDPPSHGPACWEQWKDEWSCVHGAIGDKTLWEQYQRQGVAQQPVAAVVEQEVTAEHLELHVLHVQGGKPKSAACLVCQQLPRTGEAEDDGPDDPTDVTPALDEFVVFDLAPDVQAKLDAQRAAAVTAGEAMKAGDAIQVAADGTVKATVGAHPLPLHSVDPWMVVAQALNYYGAVWDQGDPQEIGEAAEAVWRAAHGLPLSQVLVYLTGFAGTEKLPDLVAAMPREPEPVRLPSALLDAMDEDVRTQEAIDAETVVEKARKAFQEGVDRVFSPLPTNGAARTVSPPAETLDLPITTYGEYAAEFGPTLGLGETPAEFVAEATGEATHLARGTSMDWPGEPDWHLGGHVRLREGKGAVGRITHRETRIGVVPGGPGGGQRVEVLGCHVHWGEADGRPVVTYHLVEDLVQVDYQPSAERA